MSAARQAQNFRARTLLTRRYESLARYRTLVVPGRKSVTALTVLVNWTSGPQMLLSRFKLSFWQILRSFFHS